MTRYKTFAERPLVHIGYPKCASTWLQQLFFNRENGFIQAVGPMGVSLLVSRVLDTGGAIAEQSAVSGLVERCAEKLKHPQAKGFVPVCSSEHLSGNFMRGAPDSELLADILKSAFPEARILIVIREQRALLASLYKTLLAWGHSIGVKQLLAEQPANESWASWLEYLRFHRIINLYVERFGDDNVHVLPYETLCKQPEYELREIQRFAGVSESIAPLAAAQFGNVINPNSDYFRLLTAGLMNRVLINSHSPTGLIRETDNIHQWRIEMLNSERSMGVWDKPFKSLLRRKIDFHARNKFADSNKLVSARLGLALESLGYQA